MMKRFPPSTALAKIVRTYEIVESDEGMTRAHLPEAALVMSFRYGGSAAVVDDDGERPIGPRALSGLRSSARRMRTSPGGKVLLAKLRVAGAASIFREPLHEIFGAARPLDEMLGPPELERVNDRIAASKTDAERIAHLERFLLASIRSAESDPLVTAAARAIDLDPSVKIAPLAKKLGVSQDTLEKRFRHAAGASPKRLAWIVRFERAIAAYRPATNLTRLAVDSGYADQSHFIREFRRATGVSPRRFFGSPERC